VRAKWAAMLTFENPINSLSAMGLSLGALCRMAGTFVVRPHIQALLWAIDGAAALVMAAALLTLKHFRRGRDVVAAAG
jgi:drug/metabolite transporter superfamily protein YnfA